MSQTGDLAWAGGILVAVTAALYWLMVRWTRGWSRKGLALLGAGAIVAIAAFALWLFDSALLLRMLPFSNTVFLGNWLMPLSAILAAVIWRSLQVPPWRRSLTGAGVIMIAAIITFRPVIAHKPVVENRWQHGVCLQTTQATCTAAAAATLLKLHGIESNEAEMSRLSLTTRRGTLFHGAYRGLALRTGRSAWRVRAFNGSFEQLQRLGRPALVRVGARRGQKVNPRYATEWGFVPGVTHSIVVLGFSADGRVEVADPTEGRASWDLEMLRTLWHGIGLTLVPAPSR